MLFHKLIASPSRQVIWPERILEREGLHDEVQEKALLNSAPSRASRSNPGTLSHLSP
jgi:hypothetical protein